MARPPITTHVLDLVNGKPASGVDVHLHQGDRLIADGTTNEDGRVESWSQDYSLATGKYRLVFNVEPWFAVRAVQSFYEDRAHFGLSFVVGAEQFLGRCDVRRGAAEH